MNRVLANELQDYKKKEVYIMHVFNLQEFNSAKREKGKVIEIGQHCVLAISPNSCPVLIPS
jgi:hypothetical protein